MRLSEYPYVVVRLGCSKCARRGAYRLARLAERFGAEIEVVAMLSHLSANCSRRDVKASIHDYCGAFLPDLSSGRPPDTPGAIQGHQSKLRIVR